MTARPDRDATDADLATAAAAGDRPAFAAIYDRYTDRLHDFCIGLLRDRDAAADCVQDAFCTAATTFPHTASIAASVRVASRGWITTSIPSDF